MGLSSDIEKSDILPLINLIWPRSFGRRNTNQQAISDCGWNPLNRRLLTDPEILKTKSITTFTPAPTPTDDSLALPDDVVFPPDGPPDEPPEGPPHGPPDGAVSPPPLNCPTIVTAPGLAPSTCSTIETEPTVLPWIDLDNVNFDRGLAGEFSIDILQHIVKKENVRQNLSKRYKEGRCVRGMIDTTKRLTGGNMFKSNHIVCDEEVLAIREGKEEEKTDKKRGAVEKVVDKFNKREIAYLELIQSRKDETEYRNEDYKKVIHFKKRKLDKAVSTLAIDLKMRFMEIKQRGNPTLIEHLTDLGLYTDADNVEIVDSIIAQLGASEGRIVECEAPPVGEAMVNGSADILVECKEI